MVEQAGDAAAFDALEIVLDRALALRREQLGEIAPHQFGAVIAEQRFGAAVAGIDVALGIEHHDAFGRGVEDGAEFLGIGVADGGWFRAARRGMADRGGDLRFPDLRLAARAGEDQRQRGIVVPADGVEARVDRRGVFAAACGAEIVTGVPVSDVLQALETPGST